MTMLESLILTQDPIVCLFLILIGLAISFAGRLMLRLAVSFAISLLICGMLFNVVFTSTGSWILSAIVTFIVFVVVIGLGMAFSRIVISALLGIYLGRVISCILIELLGLSTGLLSYELLFEVLITAGIGFTIYKFMDLTMSIIVILLGFFLLLTGLLGLRVHEPSALMAAGAIGIAGAMIQYRLKK